MSAVGSAPRRAPVIQTPSRRLAWAARLSRLLPPGLSGVFLRFYPATRAAREKPGFTARSSLADFIVRTDRTDWVANAFAVRGFYDLGNAVIANAVCESGGETILEVGANIGTESLLFAHVVGARGRVVCFEPLPDNFRILRELLALNGLSHVHVHQAAVSESAGVLRFLQPHAGMNFGEGRIAEHDAPREAVIEVPSVVLDEQFAAGAFDAPRLIAIDVQGAELFVLRGATRLLEQAKPVVVAEVEPTLMANHQQSPHDLHRFFAQRGYGVWRVDKWGLSAPDPARDDSVNWLCIPDGASEGAQRQARRISARLWRAAFFPLWSGLNPAVVPRR